MWQHGKSSGQEVQHNGEMDKSETVNEAPTMNRKHQEATSSGCTCQEGRPDTKKGDGEAVASIALNPEQAELKQQTERKASPLPGSAAPPSPLAPRSFQVQEHAEELRRFPIVVGELRTRGSNMFHTSCGVDSILRQASFSKPAKPCLLKLQRQVRFLMPG